MTGAAPQPGATDRDREDAGAPAAVEAGTTAMRDPQPLSSLTSLIGDGVAGGSTCTADGLCD